MDATEFYNISIHEKFWFKGEKFRRVELKGFESKSNAVRLSDNEYMFIDDNDLVQRIL